MLYKPIAVALLATTLATPVKSTATGPQIVTEAVAAMTHVANFHYVNSYTSKGLTEYANVSVSPGGGGGTLRVDGAVVQLVSYGHEYYLKGNERSLYTLAGHDAAWAKKFANKWTRFSTTTGSNAINAYWVAWTRSSRVIHTAVPGKLVSGFVKSGETIWDGHSAVVLRDVFGLELYVASTGTPYLLHEQGGGASYNFTDFGDAPVPSAPKSFYPQ